MNALRRVLVACMAMMAAQAVADPGPWKTVTFPVEAGIVSSVAIEAGRVAVGLTAGGVKIVDTGTSETRSISDPVFGPKGRILSLAWFEGSLWIASQKGLHRLDATDSVISRDPSEVPAGLRSGVKILKTQGGVLWAATNRKLGRVGGGGGRSYREWSFPVEAEPTGLLKVAGRILVGTANKGLFILDTASDRWVRFGIADGLSSDQISALEWTGDQVLVGTPEGLDALELSGLQSRRATGGIAISWMTQVNGAVFAQTLEGLVRIDPKTFESKAVEVPAGLQAEGDLSFAEGVLAVGCSNTLALRQQPTFLGVEPLRPVAEGFAVRLPKALPAPVQLQALLRLPEWPAVKVPIGVSLRGDGRDVVLALPSDTKGQVQIDFLAVAGGRILETRSMEGDGDRAKPTLSLDPVGPVTNRQDLTLSGIVSGVGPLVFEMRPSNQNLSVGAMGDFKGKVRLSAGENRLELRLQDALGNQVQRDLVVRLDDKAPRILPVAVDTVEGSALRVRVPFRDESEVRVAVEPATGTRSAVFDSFVVFEARNLAPGDNSWKLSFVDEAGNASTTVLRAFSRQNVSNLRGKDGTAKHDSSKIARDRRCDDSAKASIHVIRYRMEPDETIRSVAKKFYGVKEMDAILVRWNGLENSRSKLGKGGVLEIPMWKGFEYGTTDAAEALEHFPWGDAPPDRKALP